MQVLINDLCVTLFLFYILTPISKGMLSVSDLFHDIKHLIFMQLGAVFLASFHHYQ